MAAEKSAGLPNASHSAASAKTTTSNKAKALNPFASLANTI